MHLEEVRQHEILERLFHFDIGLFFCPRLLRFFTESYHQLAQISALKTLPRFFFFFLQRREDSSPETATNKVHSHSLLRILLQRLPLELVDTARRMRVLTTHSTNDPE